MSRADHQPKTGPVVRPERSLEERQERCGTAIALIMATETGTTPITVRFEDPDAKPVTLEEAPRPLQEFQGRRAVSYAIEAACRAQVSGIFVLTVEDLLEEVTVAAQETLASLTEEGLECPVLAFLKYDREEDLATTRQGGNFMLYEVSYGVLGIARRCLEQIPAADKVLLLASDQVRITADHLFELCADADDHPGTEVIASWADCLRRPPYLYTREFLEDLPASKRILRKVGGLDRPLPHLSFRDHVFGEERLGADSVVPAGVEEFTEGVTLSALQAVRLAAWGRDHRGEAIVPADHADLIGPSQIRELGAADKRLVDIAVRTLTRLDLGLDSIESNDLAKAEAVGQRNRRDFPLLCDAQHKNRLVYLDSAATGQRLGAAFHAQAEFDLHGNANVYRGGYRLSTDATNAYDQARSRVERFIGARGRELVFTANASASCALVASAWGERNIEAGDVIVCTEAEHHSNMLPFALLAERKGAQMVYLPLDDEGRISKQAFEQALAQKPKLVCVAQVGNVLGIANPVHTMAVKAHQAGARVLVDAAQSLPHLKVDVRALGADFLVFSGHKLYGPMGIGGLWVSPEAFDEMDPRAAGGGTVAHAGFESYYLRPQACQYELGTPPVSQAIGLAAAVDYLDSLGMEAVSEHDRTLTRYLVRGLRGIEGVTVWGDHSQPDGQMGLVAFSLRGVGPAELGGFLGKLDVAIRSGGHCAVPLHGRMGLLGTGRVSFGVYSTVEDVQACLVAIEACRAAYLGEL
ncbi:MAG: aminotransferase class V-fold PLP-dependent enzyme [Coriobacteriales bacterium]|nr:aminotransferase class V-fold PLP-dependent enzyme [Coriobacteriales bacterium]